jgi:hypothetical protein
MFVTVDSQQVRLNEPEDTRTFHILIVDDVDVDARLRREGWGQLDGDDALISIEAVRAAARGRVREGWTEAFTAMLDYARTRGWLVDEQFIQGHLEHTTATNPPCDETASCLLPIRAMKSIDGFSILAPTIASGTSDEQARASAGVADKQVETRSDGGCPGSVHHG